MKIKNAITDLNIPTSEGGFYAGFNQFVTLGAKLLVILLVIWAAMDPERAGS